MSVSNTRNDLVGRSRLTLDPTCVIWEASTVHETDDTMASTRLHIGSTALEMCSVIGGGNTTVFSVAEEMREEGGILVELDALGLRQPLLFRVGSLEEEENSSEIENEPFVSATANALETVSVKELDAVWSGMNCYPVSYYSGLGFEQNHQSTMGIERVFDSPNACQFWVRDEFDTWQEVLDVSIAQGVVESWRGWPTTVAPANTAISSNGALQQTLS